MATWTKPTRTQMVVGLSVDEARAMWAAAFAAAVVKLSDWTPPNAMVADINVCRRLKAEELADLAVAEYRALERE